MRDSKRMFVYAGYLPGEPLIGSLYAEYVRGEELFSFEYADSWLSNPDALQFLDPDLQFYRGRQYVPSEKKLFGIFTDSCPDRWGRTLLKRREKRRLFESDFLLGVEDVGRSGGLRFKLSEKGPFLSNSGDLATPPFEKLRELENAVSAVESDNAPNEKWLHELLAPGSSLGGARPKATVADADGSLWIAKFPSKHDSFDFGAWEMVVHNLSKKCGLNVPEAKLLKVSDRGSIFLIKRFDRDGDKRIHFVSAMALLGKVDGESDSVSYLDILQFIREKSEQPEKDSLELWKRIAFNVAVSNTDDHLRNHAFILGKKGFALSPLYDVNPNPEGECLSLNINENDSSLSFDLVLETASFYGLTKSKAKQELNVLRKIVTDEWRSFAKKYGISRNSQKMMEPAFERS